MNNAKGLLCIDACVELRAPGRMSGAHDYSSGCTVRTDLGLYASSRGIVSMLMACHAGRDFSMADQRDSQDNSCMLCTQCHKTCTTAGGLQTCSCFDTGSCIHVKMASSCSMSVWSHV